MSTNRDLATPAVRDLTTLAVKSANLSDLTSAPTARTNLGLGTLATQNGTLSGTSSGTNTGDQTSIVGIAGTKAQFDTSCSDGNFQYVGDAPTAHTHAATEITTGTLSNARLPANLGTGKTVNGVVLATGGTATKYLSEDGTYTTPAGGGVTVPQSIAHALTFG